MVRIRNRSHRSDGVVGGGFRQLAVVAVAAVTLVLGTTAIAASPAVKDDPLVRMPGTQPGQVALEAPNRCLNCHSDYNQSVEPGFNWQGSMMAQAARDPLFLAAMTVGAQDAIWATGTPNATDICLRCHFPTGWLEGRSDPTNASVMTGSDFDGVSCDFCHRMYDPFYADTFIAAPADWPDFWDETNLSDTPSSPAAEQTRLADAVEAATVSLFDGGAFYVDDHPLSAEYTEAGSGQYFVSSESAKRASFADAEARHQMYYSRFHKDSSMCGTCHDVSNPVLANLTIGGTTALPTETLSAYSFFHVERTFSEFMLSGYADPGGASGKGDFAPEVFETSLPDDSIARCQDCHMRDEVGAGADKRGVPVRPNDSIEHPESGQPLHDLTGGNVWVSYLLASTVPGSPNYDAVNAALLGQGPSVLTLDLTQGLGIDAAAMLAGMDRAEQQLLLAADITDLVYSDGTLSFRVQNNTGHKLISGFPEGRRMFVNVRLYDDVGSLIYEVNPYDIAQGTLRGIGSGAAVGSGQVYVDELVYEMHPSSSLTDETETFHFVLADGRYKDNRIPPQGFDIAAAGDRLATPVWHGAEDPGYFTPDEYAGGYDEVTLTVPPGAAHVDVGLYYQTTSREYVEFLRDEINGDADTIPGGYVAQTDSFFAALKAWGNTIWDLWWHNKDVPGAAPFLMASATTGGEPPASPPIPTVLSAEPAHQEVAVTWSDEAAADTAVTGYRLYYDQADKVQLVTEVDAATISFTDTGLTNGQQYCYTVTSLYGTVESALGNVLCAVPNNQGNTYAGVSGLSTGFYETTGKGPNKTTVFVESGVFAAGDDIVIRAAVIDNSTGEPVPNSKVDILIAGPETLSLVTGPSDGSGVGEVIWATDAGRKGKTGTPLGDYTATVTGVTATGYTWDGTRIAASFTLE